MAQTQVLTGAHCKIFLAGNLYPAAQNISYTIDYGEYEIFGIDSQFAQEIAPTRVTVNGTISGIKLSRAGGLQGHGSRSTVDSLLNSPYISLRITDRKTDEDLLWVPQMKITNEVFSSATKGVVKFSFKFKGIIPYNSLDRQ